jgi:hypothetical protein
LQSFERLLLRRRRQSFDVRRDKISLARGGGLQRCAAGNPFDRAIAAAQQIVSALLHPIRNIRVGRSALGRIILKPAVGRRVMRRRDHDTVGQTFFFALVVNQERA